MAHHNEYWFTTTKRGTRQAWAYSYPAMRAVRVPLADAELDILTGQSTETTKPIYVGGTK